MITCICWTCKRSAAPPGIQCSWDASLKPVKGATIINIDNKEGDAKPLVTDCPLYVSIYSDKKPRPPVSNHKRTTRDWRELEIKRADCIKEIQSVACNGMIKRCDVSQSFYKKARRLYGGFSTACKMAGVDYIKKKRGAKNAINTTK